MEKLFNELISRKRCSEDDRANARKKIARTVREVLAEYKPLLIDPGNTVFIKGLDKLPLLNGEYCKVLRQVSEAGASAGEECFLVQRLCGGNELRVSRNYLTPDAPDGMGACVQMRAVLTRGLGRDVARKIMMQVSCHLCWNPCTPRTQGQNPHPELRFSDSEEYRPSAENECYDYECGLCDEKFILPDYISQMCPATEHSLFLPERRPALFPQFVSPDVDISIKSGLDSEGNFAWESFYRCIPKYVRRISFDFSFNLDFDGPTFELLTLNAFFCNMKCVTVVNNDWLVTLNASAAPNVEKLTVRDADIQVTNARLWSKMRYLSIIASEVPSLDELIQEVLASAPSFHILVLEDVILLESFSLTHNKLQKIEICGYRGMKNLTLDTPSLFHLSLLDDPNLLETTNFTTVNGIENCNLLQHFSIGGTGIEELHLASNALRAVSIEYMRNLTAATLWSPHLHELIWTSCPKVGSISFLDDHALKAKLPASFD